MKPATYLYGTDEVLEASWSIQNTSGRTIAAWQVTFVVSVTDRLGRTFTMRLLSDCTTQPLGAGARRAGSVSNLDAVASGERRCVAGVWDVNQFVSQEVELWTALTNGAQPRITIEKHRVSFADGSGVGTAVTAF